jgi:hypothetical protein
MQISARGRSSCMTNVTDIHTCSTCRLDLVVAMVDVVDGQLVHFSCDVVSRIGVSVPVRVDPIFVYRSR